MSYEAWFGYGNLASTTNVGSRRLSSNIPIFWSETSNIISINSYVYFLVDGDGAKFDKIHQHANPCQSPPLFHSIEQQEQACVAIHLIASAHGLFLNSRNMLTTHSYSTAGIWSWLILIQQQ